MFKNWVQFLALTLILTLLCTIFLLPRSEPGGIFSWPSGKIIDECAVIELAPIFGYGTRDQLYSFIISPSIDNYRKHKNIPLSDTLSLVATTSKIINKAGDHTSDWSFAWGYWLLIELLPSCIISFVILFLVQLYR